MQRALNRGGARAGSPRARDNDRDYRIGEMDWVGKAGRNKGAWYGWEQT